jgi:Tol biopolymer transport system component
MLWVRALNTSVAQPLLGTEEGTLPFWSPDSRFIAFFAGGRLKKIDANGGPPQPICAVSSQPRGGSWGRDGVILFCGGTRDPVSKVAAEGGAPIQVTKIGPGQYSQRWPTFLPDGRHFLFFAQTWAGQPNERDKTYIGSLDSGEARPLFHSNGAAMYAPPGYLVFVRDRMLLAQRFDPKKLQLIGEPFPIAERIESFPQTSTAIFSVSDNGVLVFQRGENSSDLHLSWFDRNGKEIETITPPGDYSHPRLSHDGKRVAYDLLDSQSGLSDIWIFDLVRRVPTRLTFEAENEAYPIWSPDDQTIAYSFQRPNGGFDLYKKPSTGAGVSEPVFASPALKFAMDWSADGKSIFIQSNDPYQRNNWDIIRVSADTGTAANLIATKFNEGVPQLSPDGRWLAYISDQAGANNVYIEPFPQTGAKYQVSTGGATQPRWRRDGKELFYRTTEDRMASVMVNATLHGLQISQPSVLFQTHLATSSGPAGAQYDVSPDGQKFLMNVSSKIGGSRPLTLITNWTAEVNR